MGVLAGVLGALPRLEVKMGCVDDQREYFQAKRREFEAVQVTATICRLPILFKGSSLSRNCPYSFLSRPSSAYVLIVGLLFCLRSDDQSGSIGRGPSALKKVSAAPTAKFYETVRLIIFVQSKAAEKTRFQEEKKAKREQLKSKLAAAKSKAKQERGECSSPAQLRAPHTGFEHTRPPLTT